MPRSSFASACARPIPCLRSVVALALAVSAPAIAHDRIDPPRPIGAEAQWFGGDSYPPAAIRAGQEGSVSVALSIGADGMVTDCRVTASSGVPALDAATCRLAIRRGRFAPAMQGGRPVASTYDLTNVQWRIRDQSVHVASSVLPAPASQ